MDTLYFCVRDSNILGCKLVQVSIYLGNAKCPLKCSSVYIQVIFEDSMLSTNLFLRHSSKYLCVLINVSVFYDSLMKYCPV